MNAHESFAHTYDGRAEVLDTDEFNLPDDQFLAHGLVPGSGQVDEVPVMRRTSSDIFPKAASEKLLGITRMPPSSPVEETTLNTLRATGKFPGGSPWLEMVRPETRLFDDKDASGQSPTETDDDFFGAGVLRLRHAVGARSLFLAVPPREALDGTAGDHLHPVPAMDTNIPTTPPNTPLNQEGEQ